MEGKIIMKIIQTTMHARTKIGMLRKKAIQSAPDS